MSDPFDFESLLADFRLVVRRSHLSADEDRIMEAARFGAVAHAEAGQLQKYTQLPYAAHFIAVASVLLEHGRPTPEVVAALLHDTVEDTAYDDIFELAERFGENEARMVAEVTNVDTEGKALSRAERKALDREHLADASAGGQNVKLADVIVNTRDIVAKDRRFAKVYLSEKAAALDVLTRGDVGLTRRAQETVQKAIQELVG